VTTPAWDEWRGQAHFVDDDHGRGVATYDLGDPAGTPLTFLHGYPSSSLDIAPVLDRLGDGWRILTVDFPGFGASAKPPGHRHTIHAAADAIERLWADRDTETTTLVAHDYGVSVGQELLARRAEGALSVEVTGIVWMNGGLYPDLHRQTIGQQLLLDPEHGAALAASLTEEPFTDGLAATWGTRVSLDVDAMHGIWCSMDDGGGVQLMHELLHYIADRREHAARWRAALEGGDLPMAFAWGDVDPVSGAHMIERVEERRPDARIERMADVGHWPLLEAPDVVAGVIRDLVAG
jgi:pimeloyl-ACP methyl ester carboxylesterase